MNAPQSYSKKAEIRQQAEERYQLKSLASPEMLKPLTPESTESLLHELRVHQIELEMQNEELRRTHEELEASHARYFDLYELAPMGYVTVNELDLIQQINLSSVILLGVIRSTMIHKLITELIYHEDQGIYHQTRKQLLETRKTQSCELRMNRHDGSQVWVYLNLTAATNHSGMAEIRLALSDISERKQNEESLDAKRNLLRTLLDLLPSSVFVKDCQSRYLLANAACARAIGADSPELLIGKTDADFFPPKIAGEYRNDELEVLMGHHSLDKEQKSYLKNGDPQVLLVSKVPLQSSAHEITGLVGVGFDITKRVQMEDELRLKDAFQLDILNSLPAHIAVLDKTGTILSVNQPWLRYGRENGSPNGENTGVGCNYLNICRAASLDADAYAKSASDGLDAVLSGIETHFNMEYPCNTPQHVSWFKMEVIPLAGKNGGAIVTHTDISERKQAQCLLAWEKCALESIVSTKLPNQVLDNLMLGLEAQLPGALCSILILDADGTHLRLGSAPSLPPEYNLAINGIAIGTAAHEDQQVIVLDIDSDPLWADYREIALKHGLHACWSTPIRSQGKILGIFSVYYQEPRSLAASDMQIIERTINLIRIAIERQLTDGKILQLNMDLERRVEERTAELQAANASLTNFKAALDEHSLVSITDTDGIITYANDKFCEMSKYKREELLGQNHRIVNSGYHPPDFFRGLWNTILSGQVWKGEIRNRAKDGTFYWVSTTIIPFLGDDGKPVQFIAIRTDISERKQAEERINKLNAALEIRATALEAANKELDSFTYSVSHDLRAPLRAIDGFSHMVIKDHAEQLNDEGRRKLNVIRNEAHRMQLLIDDLLAFSRLGRQPINSIPIDMETMAQEVFDELSSQNPKRKLRLHLQKLPPVSGSEALIRQVWINLISNAIKFTRGREIAEIEIGAQDGGDSRQIYSIKDNGVGFDMRHANKLFGVFQRLHSQDEFSGTGVGLALVQRIIIRHGGLVWAEATIDHGATFYFSLPTQQK
jgi:PAS domain S-box-containing protein